MHPENNETSIEISSGSQGTNDGRLGNHSVDPVTLMSDQDRIFFKIPIQSSRQAIEIIVDKRNRFVLYVYGRMCNQLSIHVPNAPGAGSWRH